MDNLVWYLLFIIWGVLSNAIGFKIIDFENGKFSFKNLFVVLLGCAVLSLLRRIL